MKKILATLTLMALCAAMTACTATANEPMNATTAPMAGATTTPGVMSTDGMGMDLMPDATVGIGDGMTDPMTSTDPEATGVTTVSTARRAIEQLEDELERLSEVKNAQVVLAGNSAAVALEFDSKYKSGIDDRLRGIIKERIDGVISGVTNIAVTDDKSLMEELDDLGDRLEAASDMADIQNELNAIINKITSA